MSITALKILALIAMTIDHIGVFISGTPIWFRWIGRIAAPIFVFGVSEALRYTHNREKYIIRLYKMAVLMSAVNFVISGICSLLCEGNVKIIENNIFGTLFNVALLIYIIDGFIQKKEDAKRNLAFYLLWQFFTVIIDLLLESLLAYRYPIAENLYYLCYGPLCNLLYSEGDCWIWCLIGIMFYYRPKQVRVWYLICCIVYTIPEILRIPARIVIRMQYYGWDGLYKICNTIFARLGYTTMFTDIPSLIHECQWMMAFALPFVLMYNGKYGRGMKKFFYIYYPVHIIVLFLVGNIIK